ncbi:MAG: BatD family protein [Gammaproteobacteria bacterium]|nr:BatD family protein [Gammaproteobacteria bacterium]
MVRVLQALLLWALLAGAQAMAAIDVRIERETVSISDSLRVVFTVSGEAQQPDFSPLEQDFELLGTSRNTSVTIVNGRMEQTASWTVDLMPRRVGKLTLPPIDFGNEQSPERIVTVTGASGGTAPDGEVFLEVEADPVSPYVQAQTHFTVRVFRAVSMSQASLTEPNIAEGDAVIERLGEDIAYETTRGGARFSVVERRYVIFPQRSGTIVIDPLVFEGRVGRRGSFFDSFSGGRIVRVRSETMELEVKPIPDQFNGQVWLPAERVELTEDWPGANSEWRAGEPLTRTLTLKARGLTASQLPEIGMGTPDGVRQYPDQPQLETRSADGTQISSRRETIALIPAQAGEFTLPAIEIPWWNTRSDQLEYARLPARTAQVLPAGEGSIAGTNPQILPRTESNIAGDTQRDTQRDTRDQSGSAEIGTSVVWKGISAAFALLWLATLAAWWWSRRDAPGPAEPISKPVFVASDLQRACAAHDAAAAQTELLHWAKTRWPGNAARSLGELTARLDGPLQQELHRLSRARFSASNEDWDGDALWQAFQSETKRSRVKQKPAAPELEPLYRT